MSAAALVIGSVAGVLVALAISPLGRSVPRRPSVDPNDAIPAPTVGARRGLRRLVAIGLLAGSTAVVAPPLAALVVVVALARRHRGVRVERRRRARAVADGLPDAVDLLLLCAGAGLSLPLAHPLVARRTQPPLSAALIAADSAAVAGQARADALLGELVPLGDRAAALGHVLVDHLRYGVPLTPGLERLGLELRLDRRRRAEEDARRVPVRLLGPLVTCVLPAFALLTVVPLLAVSLRNLPS